MNLQNTQLKYLPRALNYILRHYPHERSGLSFWDEVLLKMIKKHSPQTTKIIAFSLFYEGSDIDTVGDGYLFYRLHQLANQQTPLVKLSGNIQVMREMQATLTESAAKVVNQNFFMYSQSSIDDWVGGVQLLSGDNKHWLYRDGMLVFVNDFE